MIVRPKLHWFPLLFVLRGSVLPSIAPRLLGVTLLAVLVTVVHGQLLSWKVSLTFVPFSLIGLTLAIFLSFRNSTAYARFWEARSLWGELLNTSRTLAAQTLTLPQPADPAGARDFIHRLCAFSHALKHQLRGGDAAGDLAQFLPEGEARALAGAPQPTSRLLLQLHAWVGERQQRGQIAPAVVPVFERGLAQLADALGGCERIASTPIPFTYTVIIHRSVYLYCLLLPFGLVDTLGWMTPAMVCFVAYTFLALEAVGAELEDPFGTEPNDLPLDALSHGIEASLLRLIDEPPRTPEPQAVDYVLR
ncbi:hypothetical protein FVQ98_10195 [Ottowia sp. GY511]|uniref:Bestrophin family protein n=1 Tax=Ottowia flava TaxID=2675430 RepID=A0ABW4KPX9_9BURK|nr:bestrophin family ion channel [Ottowia sp. GY511]TXK28338.1 hypothetical protein FVQ98_10195 [Ottowia sp. GY511]